MPEDRGHRFAVELNEAGGDQFWLFQRPMCAKQPRRYWRRRLTLLSGALADRLAIENAAVEIDK
jgi:hypothetical protein